MSKHGLAIMIADKMPPPDKLKGGDKSEYSDSSDDGGDDDEQMEVDTVKDFFACGKSGDYQGALGHLRDLVQMLQEPGEDKW